MTKINTPICKDFSCGPTRKLPNWNINSLDTKILGRSHRSAYAFEKYKEIVTLTKSLLKIPNNYKVVLTPGSATGAIELGLFNAVSKLPVNSFAFDYFSLDRSLLFSNEMQLNNLNIYLLNNFISDSILNKFKGTGCINLVTKQGEQASNNFNAKNVNHVNIKEHAFELIDFDKQDTVLTLCGTSMAVDFKHLSKIKKDRKGLVFADATSYAFCQEIPWESFDFTAWSLQKALGSEPSLGVLVLSERAIERINSFKPAFPCPKLYNLRGEDGLIDPRVLDTGFALNTYSGLVVADALVSLNYFKEKGMDYFYNKVKENYKTADELIKNSSIYDFMIPNEDYRSLNVAYLTIKDSAFKSLNAEGQKDVIENICKILEQKDIAHDVKSYRQSPIGIRFWMGPLIDKQDIESLIKNLEDVYIKTYKK